LQRFINCEGFIFFIILTVCVIPPRMSQSIIFGEQLKHYLSQNDAIGLFVYDKHLRVREWNSYMEQVTGLNRGSCMGKPIFSVISTYKPVEDEESLRKVFQGECFMIKDNPMIINDRNGAMQQFNFLYIPLCNENEARVDRAMVMVFETEAQHKQASLLQKATMRTLRSFLKFAPMPVYIVDNKFRIKMASESFNFYIRQDKTIGKKLEELFPPAAARQLQERVSRVMEQEKAEFFNETFRLNKRQYHFFTIRFPIRNARGKVEAVGGYSLDISDRVKQEQKIHELLDESISLNEKLEEQNKELRQNRLRLEDNNQQLLQQKQELEKALKELSDRNYELDQIMYKTSHDLRSPLTSILGLLSLAKVEQDIQKLPEYHDYIEDRVLKLDNFVKSMLTYAKTSRSEITPEEVNWEQIIDESLSDLEYLSNFKKIDIRKEINLNGKPFKSDLMSLKVVFNNLVGNAIKYADLKKEHPYIHIRVEEQDREATIIIEDNGIGIDPQYLDKIGKMFFRATEMSEGSGLGMYIVKQAVEKMGGSMDLRSTAGEGTAIEVHVKSFNGMALADG
jgi:PAS domain S-box-containing protein